MRTARIRAAAAALVAVALVTAASGARAAGKQTVRGEVTAPTGVVFLTTFNAWAWCGVADATTGWAADRSLPCDAVPREDGCGDVHGRPVQPSSHRFRVDPATRGATFTLTSDRDSDLAIVFRGARDVRIDRHYLLAGDPQTERGRVPKGARTADVCLMAGLPTAFTYTAG